MKSDINIAPLYTEIIWRISVPINYNLDLTMKAVATYPVKLSGMLILMLPAALSVYVAS